MFTTPDSSVFFGSGTRLKAHVLDGGSGARALLDFYDSELETQCNFVENASGEYHCLPTQFAASYFDENCTEPALISAGADTRAGMLVSVVSSNCEALIGPYSSAEELAVPRLYSLVSGHCLEFTISLPSAWTLKPEPLTRFASGALSVVGEEGEAQALRATAEDGAYTNLSALDQGQPCIGIQFDQAERCVRTPFAHAMPDLYPNDKCSGGPELAYTTLRRTDSCAGRSAKRALVPSPRACGSESTLRAVLDPISSVFQDNGSGNCSPLDPAYFAAAVYRMGEQVPSAEAPVLSSLIVGSGALTLGATANRLGTPLTPSFFSDWRLESGERCTRYQDPDGLTRCVPGIDVYPSTNTYADSNCTQQLAQTSPCGRAPSHVLEVEQDGLGKTVLLAARIAQPHTGPVYALQSGECQPFQGVGFSRFKGGAAVDLDTFPIITEITER